MRGNPNIKSVGKTTRFKKGKSGNPNGRPVTNYRAICDRLGIDYKVKMTKDEKYAVAEALLEMSLDDLKKLEKNTRVPIFVSTFASALVQGHETGNINNIDKLFDRFFGKPTQEIVNKRMELEPTPSNLAQFTTDELSKMLRKQPVQN